MRTAASEDKGLLPLLAAAALLAMLTVLGVLDVNQSAISSYVTIVLMHGVIYLVAIITVLKWPGGTKTLVVVLLVALILRAIAMTALPNLSTDAFRYVWDGRLGWEGISPYLFVPADEQLAALRDAEIYPNLNQKERAVTIYPPVAQLLFMIGVAIQDGIAGMKALMLLCEAVTVAALIGWLRAEGLPLSRVLIYAWHPLPIWEFASQAHLDAAATTLLVLGIWAAVRKRQGLTGALFATAALVKYFPVVLLPALWRRWDWRLPVALAATMAIIALPYMSSAGTGVLGFLGQHLDNEGYRSGWGFHAVWYLREFQIADPSGAQFVAVALTILAAIAAWALFGRGADEFKPGRMVLLGAAFVFFTSPHYPWYFGFLCALAVRVPHPALLVMTITCATLQLPRLDGGYSWTHLYAMTYVLPLIVWALWKLATRYSPPLDRLNRDLLRLDTVNIRL